MANDLHPFEHFGPAPWRVVGYTELVYQACQGAPIQAAGSCDVCGTCIRHAYKVRCADGVEFITGSDCALKVNPAAYAEIKAMRAEAIREARAASRSAEAQLRRAAEEGRRLGRCHRIAFEHPEWIEMARELAAIADADAFPARVGREVLATIGQGCTPSERTIELLERCHAEHSMAPSQHFGEPGKRVEMDLTWLRSHWFETHFGLKAVHVLAGPEGQIVVWKSGNGTPHTDQGDVVRCRFTVKAHTDHNGTPQTEVARLAEAPAPKPKRARKRKATA